MYFFLLSLNNSGSTIVAQVMASYFDAFLPPFGNNEGQNIPEVLQLMKKPKEKVAFNWSDSPLPWTEIKLITDEYLKQSGKKIFIEKTPNNTIRAVEIENFFFKDKEFVGCCLVSDPYSFVSSSIRNYLKGVHDIGEARRLAERWVKMTKIQLENAEKFNLRVISYGNFCSNPLNVLSAIAEQFGIKTQEESLTELRGGKGNQHFASMRLKDQTIRHLGFLIHEEVLEINDVLSGHRDFLNQNSFEIWGSDKINNLLSSDILMAQQGSRLRNNFDNIHPVVSARKTVFRFIKRLILNS